MPLRAALYIRSIAVLGMVALGVALLGWRCESRARFVAFLVVGVVAACCKVRLPRLTGTYSLAFIPVLGAILALHWSEAILLGTVAAAAQNLWFPRAKPRVLQVAFNASVLAISIAAAYTVNAALVRAYGPAVALGSLALAVATYWILNTGVIAITLTLLEEGSLRVVWRHWSMWTFPYYLFGAAGVFVFRGSIAAGDWTGPLLSVPVVGLAYLSWRLWVQRGAESS